MINSAKNKDMKDVETKADKSEYFYSGGLTHKPVTILASSQKEADELYEKQKEIINN